MATLPVLRATLAELKKSQLDYWSAPSATWLKLPSLRVLRIEGTYGQGVISLNRWAFRS